MFQNEKYQDYYSPFLNWLNMLEVVQDGLGIGHTKRKIAYCCWSRVAPMPDVRHLCISSCGTDAKHQNCLIVNFDEISCKQACAHEFVSTLWHLEVYNLKPHICHWVYKSLSKLGTGHFGQALNFHPIFFYIFEKKPPWNFFWTTFYFLCMNLSEIKERGHLWVKTLTWQKRGGQNSEISWIFFIFGNFG